MVCDLNEPIDPLLFKRADLVTDNGTGEHLFNQAQVWANQHELTKAGGVMLKIMPFTPWFNHGFYNFNPIIYRDVAAANNYKWLFFWITDRHNTPEDLNWGFDSPLFVEKRPRTLIKLAERNWKTDLYMVAAWVKAGNAVFRTPLQGKYLKDITDDKFRESYVNDPQ